MQSYDYGVTATGRDYICSAQENLCLQLDKSMLSPYTSHIIVGRNKSKELLFVSYDRSTSDGRLALNQACGVYTCKVGYWPDFFVVRGEVHKLYVTGIAPVQCSRHITHRTMFITCESDMRTYDKMVPLSSLDFHTTLVR